MSGRVAGISMKTVIETKYEGVKSILDKSNLSDEDKEQVLDYFKEMAYQWCNSNAMACATEDAVQKLCPNVDYAKIFTVIISSGVREKKIAETLPDFGDDI